MIAKSNAKPCHHPDPRLMNPLPLMVVIIGIMDNKMETTRVYRGYIGVVENRMETTIVYWDSIEIMENKMETTIAYWG